MASFASQLVCVQDTSFLLAYIRLIHLSQSLVSGLKALLTTISVHLCAILCFFQNLKIIIFTISLVSMFYLIGTRISFHMVLRQYSIFTPNINSPMPLTVIQYPCI